jgi:hypothetical protein
MRIIRVASAALIAMLGTLVAWAGITGMISGLIEDQSGAIVPGVTVVATNEETGVQSTAVSDDKGLYSFSALAVGTYDLTVRRNGFRDFVEKSIKIDANSAIRIDIKLQLGAVSDTITVDSEALRIETQSTQMGEVIEGEQITSVPLNGRSYLDLLALQPGVNPYQGNSTTGGGEGVQSMNGGRPNSNGFMVNGADAEEKMQNGPGIVPNLDSIAEFRIITNNFNAEYGNYSGGQVNVVTKSGTNQYHGDLFDFLRNTDLDAKNYFNSTRGVFIQNQFGGTAGGPIKKDKAFWFGDYEGTRQIIGAAQYFPVPSTADRTGNLMDEASALEGSAPANGGLGVNGAYWANLLIQELGYPVTSGEPYYTPGCTKSQCVFPGAVIPTRVWSPVAVAMLKYIPTPNVPGQAYFQTSAYNETLTENKFGIRIDAKTRAGDVFGYYFFDQPSSVNPYYAVNIPGFAASTKGRNQVANMGLTTTINNSTVNDVRLVYLRNVALSGVPVQGLGPTLASLGFNTPWNSTGGIGSIVPSLVGVPSMEFNNYSFGVPPSGRNQYDNTAQAIDNLTKVFGTHNLQFGGSFHYDQINVRLSPAENGQFNFYGNETGLDFADFLIGAPSQLTQASFQVLDSRGKYYGFYGQDSWRARPNLTLNYGLRWEVSTPWFDTQNKIETLIPGEQSKVFPGAPTGVVVPGDAGVPRTLSPIRYGNFAPRFGIAYTPSASDGILGKILGGSGQTSIRAGYGLFYTSIEDIGYFFATGSAPYGLYYQSPTPPLLASPYIDRSTGHFEGIKFPFKFPPTNVSASNPDTSFNWAQVLPLTGGNYIFPGNKLPYMQDFELSIQRQLGAASVLSVSYVGTVGRQMLAFVESNPGDPALCLKLSNPAILAPTSPVCGPYGEQNVYTLANGQTVNGTRPLFGINFGSNPFTQTLASSGYNSLQASFKHTDRYSALFFAYTWSKSIDNGSGLADPVDNYDPRRSRGLSIFDMPQDLTVSYTVQLPFNKFTGGNDLAQYFLGGWALSGISTFASGEPIQLSESDDRSLSGTFGGPIDTPSAANNGSKLYVNRNPRNPNDSYFNPNYFVAESLGQIGNVSRRFFIGPGILNSDLALLKTTDLWETTKIQFRAEAFNVFNHAQFNNPSGNFNNSGQGGFGYVTSARDPRIMQVALKFLF